MYRHLLVALDSTDLSVEGVGNAVGLARAVGARITFLHTRPDVHAGHAAEALAKAEAAARATGVPCSSVQAASDQAATVIGEAARSRGCDLIFMAAGRPGAAQSAQSLGPLMDAGLPVLLPGAGEPGPPAHAIGILRDEHRSLAAALHAWMHALASARSAGSAADPALMRSVARYVELFSTMLHHPKEERHLFRLLRARTHAFDTELDELERQHRRDHELVADLARRVDALAAAGGSAAIDATRELEDAVRAYAAFQWEHLGREEGLILPAAQRHLREQDWLEIDSAFRANRIGHDWNEADKVWRQLFSRIVNAVPHE